MSDQKYHAISKVEAIEDGAAISYTVANQSILICNFDGQFFAIENKCSHADEPLECGRIRNGWISCPAHGARFDLATGDPINPPATTAIKTYPVRVVDHVIEVAV